MQCQELNLTKEQERTLEKKKLISVESFLRKPPLHYWDFSETLPLLMLNPKTRNKIENLAPFAIIGTCTAFSIEKKEHMMMVKMRVTDEASGNTLFVNVMSSETLKMNELTHDKKHPVNHEYLLPEDIRKMYEMPTDGVNQKCKRQIDELNKRKSVNAKDLLMLKTAGIDAFSYLKLNIAKEKMKEKIN